MQIVANTDLRLKSLLFVEGDGRKSSRRYKNKDKLMKI